ncbi:ABC-F family ATP-binding cassette domain-containing protein [Brotaphodocola catenula]|uniref:ABC-F family ATP-binding cassette domain-containing protein n=1 Tax=Brotaphodocola catenula TaxID=2885361 RepID=A0AAE3DJP9_9FIRM|nr:ABC-F family ATP-binding cassette domain-containing protein [Brotaphodocola catenula]MCC2164342.1 ABC-F family ATP-binding cassette domain-containing protein [Brotaphodocola catenula]
MSLITIEHLTKSYTERLLFDDTSFSIGDGEKVGLIGINGTGKSTLLKIVAGLEEPDDGSVIRRRNLYIRYLPQIPQFMPGDSVLDSIVRDNRNEPHFTSREEIEASAKTILTKLGIYDFTAKVETLSGGQRKRVALTSVLLSTADLLILDEPTNHLDSEMADWLEDYLKKFRGALLMITHDRYFLDSVTNRIVELDKGKLYSYQSNYEGFLKLKAERLDMMAASERKRQSILRTELAWMQRGARARSTKQKAHIQRYEALRDQEAPELTDGQVEMESISSRLGRTTVEIEHLSKAYGDKVLMRDFNYVFLKNDRIGIIGPNGSGKSTLMKMIAGWVKPDSGTIEIGQTVKLGYFSQENEDMDVSLKVIDYIRNVAEYVQTKDGSISASQMLERFLFPSSVQYTTISRLSGGERRRLYLLRILMSAPNVLLLDEPTNDLDIRTLMILEDYLDSFQGIVITVSHDRYFLDRVVRRIFAFEGDGNVVQYEGGFTDYQVAYQRKLAQGEGSGMSGGSGSQGGNGGAGSASGADGAGMESGASVKSSQDGRAHQKKLKFSYKEQKEWETIEDEIAGLEEAIESLDAQIAVSATDYGKLNQLMTEKAEKEAQLEEKMDRWVYLNDLAEQIEAQKTR